MNTTNTTTSHKRWRDIEAATAKLHGCARAVSTAASAFAASMSMAMLDGDGAYELLISIHERQTHALAKLDELVLHGLAATRHEHPTPQAPPPA